MGDGGDHGCVDDAYTVVDVVDGTVASADATMTAVVPVVHYVNNTIHVFASAATTPTTSQRRSNIITHPNTQ